MLGRGINGGAMHDLESHVVNIEKLDLVYFRNRTSRHYWEYIL